MTPDTDIRALIAAHRDGHALQREFYTDPAVFRHDMEDVFFTEWLLAAHVSEIPAPGDYVLFPVMAESIIICRDADNQVRAFANVCRHRGSRVCVAPKGHVRRFTCPYHAWSYGLDGSLFNAPLLGAGTDRGALALKPVRVRVFHGLIYVSLAAQPASFEALERDLDPVLAPFGLAHTRIAHRASYSVRANWKLLVENYNECYHCATAHPEFSRSHASHMTAERVAPLNARMTARSLACGVPGETIDHIAGNRPDAAPDYTYSRYALFDGFATGSEDGQPLAPLLGTISGYDGGASDVYVGMLNPMLVYCDHAVIYRFIPIDKDNSVQEIIWLVHQDAVAGRDYDLGRLIWLWDVTTTADKRIIENNQQGVNSRYYEPGPLVQRMETYTQRFLDAYLANLGQNLAKGSA